MENDAWGFLASLGAEEAKAPDPSERAERMSGDVLLLALGGQKGPSRAGHCLFKGPGPLARDPPSPL